ncbi:MAG: ATP-binding protein [Kofleriaceae bacterium]|nr:ATP-binding protein [Myxococcales bacterium]MCB9571973.1 ATP-binding protein [Kofleriaceae bacterium]
MARLHLILGPVGAGKSTLARRLAAEHRALRLALDDWMARLYGGDARPTDGGERVAWYVERTERCLAVIWEVAAQGVAAGTDVVLEIGLIRRVDRARFYDRVDATGAPLAVYLVDAPREVRRARVQRRNVEQGETFAMEVPLPFFELASDLWEPPDDVERAERRIVDVAPGTDG